MPYGPWKFDCDIAPQFQCTEVLAYQDNWESWASAQVVMLPQYIQQTQAFSLGLVSWLSEASDHLIQQVMGSP